MSQDLDSSATQLKKKYIASLTTSLFKLKRFRSPKRNVCAVYNKFFRVIRNSKGVYFYECADFHSMKYEQIYKGDKVAFLTKEVMYFMTIIYNLFYIPLLFLIYYPLAYMNGAVNFVKDNACVNGVRFFNWVNFIFFIVVIGKIILKNLFDF